LTGGEAHDCPVAGRLIRKHMLSAKAYDSPELRDELHEPVIPNRSCGCEASATLA